MPELPDWLTPERLDDAIQLCKSMSRGESFIVSMGPGWSGPAQLSRRNADLMYDIERLLAAYRSATEKGAGK